MIKAFRSKNVPQAYKTDMEYYAFNECKQSISRPYLKKKLARNDYIVLALKPCTETRRKQTRMQTRQKLCVAGFALVTISEGGGLLLDLICSQNRMGRPIMQRVEKMARQQGRDWVKLYAIDERPVWSFYESLNYKYIKNPCTQAGERLQYQREGDQKLLVMSKCLKR